MNPGNFTQDLQIAPQKLMSPQMTHSSISPTPMSPTDQLPTLTHPNTISSVTHLQPRLTSSIPPPPPLLKIPNFTQSMNNATSRLPAMSSAPSRLQIHQTPFQASSQDSINANGTPNLTAHLKALLKAPPSVPVQTQETSIQRRLVEINQIESPQSYLPLTLPHDDPGPGPSHSRSISDDSEFSSGDLREISNAAKCREYREKNKEKRKADELNYQRALKRNIELKKINQKREESIKRLKEYYNKMLNEGKVKKCKKKKKHKKKEINTDTEASPMVTIKEEIDMKTETDVNDEYLLSSP